MTYVHIILKAHEIYTQYSGDCCQCLQQAVLTMGPAANSAGKPASAVASFADPSTARGCSSPCFIHAQEEMLANRRSPLLIHAAEPLHPLLGRFLCCWTASSAGEAALRAVPEAAVPSLPATPLTSISLCRRSLFPFIPLPPPPPPSPPLPPLPSGGAPPGQVPAARGSREGALPQADEREGVRVAGHGAGRH